MAESGRRQLFTLSIIPRYPRSVTTSYIKNKLSDIGISAPMRMVQRDLESLERTYPLICDDTSKPYKWCWMQDAQGELFPAMEPIQAFTLAMAMQHLKSLMPKSSLRRIESYFQLALQTLSQHEQKKLKSWLKKIQVFPRGQPLVMATIRNSVEEAIYEALLNDYKFNAHYRKRGEKSSSFYIVNPLGLVSRSAVHYLICSLDHDPETIRWLPLHRFTKAIKLEESSNVPNDFDLKRFLDNNTLGFLMSNKDLKLELIFESDAGFHLLETPLNKTQQIHRLKDGRLRVKATVADTSELRFWISGFAQKVEVIKPKFLREEFIKRSKAISKLYK